MITVVASSDSCVRACTQKKGSLISATREPYLWSTVEGVRDGAVYDLELFLVVDPDRLVSAGKVEQPASNRIELVISKFNWFKKNRFHYITPFSSYEQSHQMLQVGTDRA